MAASTESGRPRTLNKETNSDIPSLREDGCESANTKILRRATFKIDLYLIPILGMICMTLSPSLLLSAHLPLDLLSFLVSACSIARFEVSTAVT
jgi:hypothetical protein